MKSIVLAISLALLLPITAFAKVFEYTACTKDHQAVRIGIDINDDSIVVNPKIPSEIEKAFQTAAASLTVEEFQGSAGFLAFAENMSEEDFYAIIGMSGAPVVTGPCKE